MATKKIILKESNIKDIVEKVINELDWRTYASAYDKEKSNPARSSRFKDAATNAFNRQNGYGMSNIPYGDGDPSQTQFNPKGSVYGGSMLYTPKGTRFNTASGKTTQDGQNFDTVYNTQSVNQHNTRYNGQRGAVSDVDMGDIDMGDVKNGSTLNPKLKMRQMKGDKQVRNFYNGKSKYTLGKGWSNESIVRALTESVMKKIKNM